MMKKTSVILRDQIIFRLQKCLKELLQPVIDTMGPGGKLVAIQDDNGVRFTKDGVTVLRSIFGNDKFEQTIIHAIQCACEKTNSIVGDGTTTTVCFISEIMKQALKLMPTSFSLSKLIQGLELARDDVNKELLSLRIKPDTTMLSHVATVAVNNDRKLGDIISKAINIIDPKYGIIHVEDGKGMSTELEFINGHTIPCGYASVCFAARTKDGNLNFNNAAVLLVNGQLNDQEFVSKFLNDLSITNRQGIIICDKLDTNLLKLILFNLYQNTLSGIAVIHNDNPDSKLKHLKHAALFTGAKILDLGVEEIENMKYDEQLLGNAKSARITQRETVLMFDSSNAMIKARVEEECRFIKNEMDKLEANDDAYKKLQEEYNQLQGKAAIIKVGAATESEINEIKDRVYDAVSSVKSATNGVCFGGGLSFFRIREALLQREHEHLSLETKYGYQIVLDSLQAPIVQIIHNVGCDSYKILHELRTREQKFGYDANNNQIVDLTSHGILDSYLVSYHAFNNAISICKMLMSTFNVITTTEKENNKKLF